MRWWVLAIVVLGCDGGGSRIFTPPLPRPDAAIDGAIDANPATAVTLTVTLDGAPRPGVLVYFQTSNLGPSTEVRTDAAGTAIAVLGSGLYDIPSVTVVNPFGPRDATTDELFTYDYVRPGDHLQLTRTSPPRALSFLFVAPVNTPAASYRLHTTCGGASIPADPSAARISAAVTLRGCGATVDMLLEAIDASGESLNWLYRPDVTVRDGSTVELRGSYQPSRMKTFSYATLDVRGPQIEIRPRLMTGKGIVYDGAKRTIALSFRDNHPALAIAVPLVPGTIAVTESTYASGTAGLEHTIDWGPDADRYDLDLDAPGGHFLEAYESTPMFNGSAVGYSYSGGAVRTDYMRARIVIERSGGRTWAWQLVGAMGGFGNPPVWPEIPLGSNGGTVVRVEEATTVSAAGGYDAIRVRAHSIPRLLDTVAGPSGRILFEEMLPP